CNRLSALRQLAVALFEASLQLFDSACALFGCRTALTFRPMQLDDSSSIRSQCIELRHTFRVLLGQPVETRLRWCELGMSAPAAQDPRDPETREHGDDRYADFVHLPSPSVL